MNYIKISPVVIVFCFFISCKQTKEIKEESSSESIETIDNGTSQEELNYVLVDSFPVGDIRRYGIKIGGGDPKHPYTKELTTQSLFELAEKEKIELFFPKGFYNFGLYFKGVKNVIIKFDDAEFAGPIYITEDKDKEESSDIEFKGTLSTYYKFFSRNCSDITIENLIIKSDITKNAAGLRSMGCDIYGGSNYISFKNLVIEDLGSGSEKYGLSRAALQVHGWNNNPMGLSIDKIHIKSSDRHGVYLTGKEHSIGQIIIDKFGVGDINDTRGLEDSDEGEYKNITGVWLNRFTNSQIDKITINTKGSKGKYAIWLDAGNIGEPSIIGELVLNGGDRELPIFADEITNTVVQRLENN